MANFKLTQTKEQIQADLDLLDKNSATQGQVLTADGVGGAIWQEPSGGTEVVANPAGEATEELTKLQVGSSVYSIPVGGSGVSIGAGFNLTIQDSFASGLEGDIFILGKNPDGVFGWHQQSIFSAWVTYTNVIMFQNTTTKNGLSIRTANAVLNTKTNSYMPVGLIGKGTNQYTLFLLNKDTVLQGEE